MTLKNKKKTVGVQTIMLKHPIKQKKRTPTKPIYCITLHKNNPLHKLMMTDRQTDRHTHTYTHTHTHTYTHTHTHTQTHTHTHTH